MNDDEWTEEHERQYESMRLLLRERERRRRLMATDPRVPPLPASEGEVTFPEAPAALERVRAANDRYECELIASLS